MKLHGVLRYFQSSGNILVTQPFCQHGQNFQFSGTECFVRNKLARLGISRQQREHVFTAEYDQSGGGAQNGGYDLSARSVSG